METENFNEEFFLKCVTNFPVLYDLSKRGYSNRHLTDQALSHISLSMHTTVDICKKKWKSLREKYYREKQKLDMLTRSGAAASHTISRPLMSFFNYMFDKKEPRKTSSSALLEIDCQTNNMSNNSQAPLPVSPVWESDIPDENFDSFNDLNETEVPQSRAAESVTGSENINLTLNGVPSKKYKRERKRTAQADNTNYLEDIQGSEMLGILGKISSSMEKVSTYPASEKIATFIKYVESEVREFPQNVQEEFIDETIIRLLQNKRKLRSTP